MVSAHHILKGKGLLSFQKCPVTAGQTHSTRRTDSLARTSGLSPPPRSVESHARRAVLPHAVLGKAAHAAPPSPPILSRALRGPGRCLLLCSPGNRSQETESPLRYWPDR